MDPEICGSPEFVEMIGLEEFANQRQYGRERGLNPVATEAQVRAVDKLNQRINNKVSKAKKGLEEEEESVMFDLKSKPRVILFESPLLKKSINSIVQHNSRRYGYLLNDVLLITTLPTSTSVFSTTDRIELHQIFYLDQISIKDMKNIDDSEDPCTFEIRNSERPFTFTAESESDKKIWLEELEAAIFCIMTSKEEKKIGWFHDVIRGTFHSAALFGEKELVKKWISRRSGNTMDPVDESGMTPLHWASMNGHKDVVDMLINAGADVDFLNGGLNSALLLAAGFSQKEVVMKLLDSGADSNVKNLKDYDCLLMTVVFAIDTPAMCDIVLALLARGVDVNREGISGATPLHECASRNLSFSIQTLVDAGADINVKHRRSGLTPLQLACSASIPDAETVRTLLDKGALANWKDTSKRSAFDMVLQSSKSGSSPSKSGGSNSKGLKETVDDVAEFVQVFLPVIMEIVRKGGRYLPESIQHLRNSFQEVILSGRETWKIIVEPTNFSDYVGSLGEAAAIPKQRWTSDSASPHCLLCLDKFTYANRRHHCRSCGVLCCDPCSTKRMGLKAIAHSSSGGSPPPSGKKSEDRVCDSCFNRLSFECYQWTQEQARIRKEHERLEQSMLESRAKFLSENAKANSPLITSKNVASSTAAVQGTMAETMRAMEERGEKLNQVAEKSEQMKEAASDFRRMTKELLRKQQQNKSSGW